MVAILLTFTVVPGDVDFFLYLVRCFLGFYSYFSVADGAVPVARVVPAYSCRKHSLAKDLVHVFTFSSHWCCSGSSCLRWT